MTWKAMSGFLLSAVGLPVLGVAAVASQAASASWQGRVHPAFAFLFTLLIYLHRPVPGHSQDLQHFL